MTISNILKKAGDKKIVLNYSGSLAEFENSTEAEFEFEQYDILDEEAKYHITKTTLFIEVK